MNNVNFICSLAVLALAACSAAVATDPARVTGGLGAEGGDAAGGASCDNPDGSLPTGDGGGYYDEDGGHGHGGGHGGGHGHDGGGGSYDGGVTYDGGGGTFDASPPDCDVDAGTFHWDYDAGDWCHKVYPPIPWPGCGYYPRDGGGWGFDGGGYTHDPDAGPDAGWTYTCDDTWAPGGSGWGNDGGGGDDAGGGYDGGGYDSIDSGPGCFPQDGGY